MMFWFLLAAQAEVPRNQGLYPVRYSQYKFVVGADRFATHPGLKCRAC